MKTTLTDDEVTVLPCNQQEVCDLTPRVTIDGGAAVGVHSSGGSVSVNSELDAAASSDSEASQGGQVMNVQPPPQPNPPPPPQPNPQPNPQPQPFAMNPPNGNGAWAKNVKPHEFSGKPEESVSKYLEKFAKIATANGWTDDDCLRILPCYLDGAAADFFALWESNMMILANQPNHNWATLKRDLCEAFQRPGERECIDVQLRNKVQGKDEPVQSQMNPAMDETEKVKYLLRGLRPYLLQKIGTMKADTPEELMANIQKFQELQVLTEKPQSETLEKKVSFMEKNKTRGLDRFEREREIERDYQPRHGNSSSNAAPQQQARASSYYNRGEAAIPPPRFREESTGTSNNARGFYREETPGTSNNARGYYNLRSGSMQPNRNIDMGVNNRNAPRFNAGNMPTRTSDGRTAHSGPTKVGKLEKAAQMGDCAAVNALTPTLNFDRNVAFPSQEEVPVSDKTSTEAVKGSEQNTSTASNKIEKYEKYTLVLNKDLRLAPREHIVWEPPNMIELAEENLEFSHIENNNYTSKIDSLLTFINGKPCMNIVNKTGEPQTLLQGMKIGYLQYIQTKDITSGVYSVDTLQFGDVSINRENIGSDLDSEQVIFFGDLITEYNDVFCNDIRELTVTNKVVHDIKLTEDAKPVRMSPYRVSPKQKEIMEKLVGDLVDAGVCAPCETSPWATPILLVKKKEGDFGIAWDARKVNQYIEPNAWPIPNILDIISYLGGANYYSVLDQMSGFYQIKLTDRSKQIATFCTPFGGLFSWQRDPQTQRLKPCHFISRSLSEPEQKWHIGKHISGKAHHLADCLSRMPVGGADKTDFDEIPTYKREEEESTKIEQEVTLAVDDAEMKTMQSRDKDLSILIGALTDPTGYESGVLRRAKNFILKNEILYRKNVNSRDLHLLCVPEELKKDMLFAVHSSPLGGHLGFAKSFDKLNRRYYWLNMKKDTKNFIKQCVDCQMRNKKRVTNQGLLQPIEVGQPWERCGIDVCGPFHTTLDGNKLIVTATDYLTKWVEARAIKNADAESIADFIFEQIICRHGSCKILLSDQALVFKGEIVRELMILVGGSNNYTTGYRPQTNSLEERFNWTLANMLSQYTDSRQENWDKCLSPVVFAFNSSVQATTKFSPFELVYGRLPLLPIDQALAPNPTTEYVTQRKFDLEQAREIAKQNIKVAQGKMNERYDSTHKAVEFQLMHKNYGPFVITRKISDLNYEIERTRGRKKELVKEIVHVSRMTPFHESNSDSDQSSSDSEEEIQHVLHKFCDVIN
ncbi:hypothetical protein B566_EDAN010166 [Ephemera danica]|nr:hypothetical protein B566_EDAN010166 [Ephemera danica]